MRKPGQIEPVFYFVCGDSALADNNRPVGYIVLAPYTGGGDRCLCPTPPGYRLEYADTLAAVDRLERTLQQQEVEAAEREHLRDVSLLEARRKEWRDRIYQRITSSVTDEWTREFLKLYLQLSDERKRKVYAQRFLERESYLWARHNDTPKGRRADSEEFNPERHTVKS
jgi:hypothetical protein